MSIINIQFLSPNSTDLFPCIGTHTQFHHEDREPIPDNIAIRVGINPANEHNARAMLVKLPYTDTNRNLKKILINKLQTKYPVTVRFSGLRCYSYEYNGTSGYTGYAKSFEIMEE